MLPSPVRPQRASRPPSFQSRGIKCTTLMNVAASRHMNKQPGRLLGDQGLLQCVEVRNDIARKDLADILIVYERRNTVLRLQKSDEHFWVSDWERIEKTHRLVDLDVGKRLCVRVEMWPLQDALREDVSLHLPRASVRMSFRRDPKARELFRRQKRPQPRDRRLGRHVRTHSRHEVVAPFVARVPEYVIV